MDGLGQLSVYVVENNLMYQNPVWTSPGHVENKWIRVQLALNPTKYKVSEDKGIMTHPTYESYDLFGFVVGRSGS